MPSFAVSCPKSIREKEERDREQTLQVMSTDSDADAPSLDETISLSQHLAEMAIHEDSHPTTLTEEIEGESSRVEAQQNGHAEGASKIRGINNKGVDKTVQSEIKSCIVCQSELRESTTSCVRLSRADCFSAWKNERNPILRKIREVACKLSNSRCHRINIEMRIRSVCQQAHIVLDTQSETIPYTQSETIPSCGGNLFLSKIFFNSVFVALGKSTCSERDSKINACEAAYATVLSPHMRIVGKELQVSEEPFKSDGSSDIRAHATDLSPTHLCASHTPNPQQEAVSPTPSKKVSSTTTTELDKLNKCNSNQQEIECIVTVSKEVPPTPKLDSGKSGNAQLQEIVSEISSKEVSSTSNSDFGKLSKAPLQPTDCSKIDASVKSDQFRPIKILVRPKTSSTAVPSFPKSELGDLNKELEDLIIIEPMEPHGLCPAELLRWCADLSCMQLRYEYQTQGSSVRCVIYIDTWLIAVAAGECEESSRNAASAHGLKSLKRFCWVLKMKKALVSDLPLAEPKASDKLDPRSASLGWDRLLQKLGRAGECKAKSGSQRTEPVKVTSSCSRADLGLHVAKKPTIHLSKVVRGVLKTYAASGVREDFVFSTEFDTEERQTINNECQKLNLRCAAQKSGDVSLRVSPIKSLRQLFNHVRACGGKTAEYKLLAPGSELDEIESEENIICCVRFTDSNMLVARAESSTSKAIAEGWLNNGNSPPIFTHGFKFPKTYVEKTHGDSKNSGKPLDYFVILEPSEPHDLGPAEILRLSADFSRRQLNYKYVVQGSAMQCVLTIENQVLAVTMNKVAAVAKSTASAHCLSILRSCCWILKMKTLQSTLPESKEVPSETGGTGRLGPDSLGYRLLQRMGWKGGSLGKSGSGRPEPVPLAVLQSGAGLGLSSCEEHIGELREHVRQALAKYADSCSEEDLVFSFESDPKEQNLYHKGCQKLELSSSYPGEVQDACACGSFFRSGKKSFACKLTWEGEGVPRKLLPPVSEAPLPAISSAASPVARGRPKPRIPLSELYDIPRWDPWYQDFWFKDYWYYDCWFQDHWYRDYLFNRDFRYKRPQRYLPYIGLPQYPIR